VKGVYCGRETERLLGWRLWRRGGVECNFTCPYLAPTWRTDFFSGVRADYGESKEPKNREEWRKLTNKMFQSLRSATTIAKVVK
jgi:hypothetical protein